jgi:hypothetical protein
MQGAVDTFASRHHIGTSHKGETVTAALVDQTPLRACAARAGGVMPLCRALGVTRQTFYDAEREGGFTVALALSVARLTGADPYAITRDRDIPALSIICDYFANRGK